MTITKNHLNYPHCIVFMNRSIELYDQYLESQEAIAKHLGKVYLKYQLDII